MANNQRPHRAAPVLVGLLLCGACSGMRSRDPAGTVPQGAAVSVVLEPPRDIALRCPDGVEVEPGVVEVAGRVRRVAGDSLELSVSSLRQEGHEVVASVARGCLLTLVRNSGTSVVLLSRRPGMIEGGLATAALLFMAFLLVFGAAAAGGS